mmetsp:Transcript_105542/g.283770  ORF Transcript_105542/g.283770 Transcript_105542/m.283770 type:complete len:81 (+) Transcript_105542:846-1088(+)
MRRKAVLPCRAPCSRCPRTLYHEMPHYIIRINAAHSAIDVGPDAAGYQKDQTSRPAAGKRSISRGPKPEHKVGGHWWRPA